MNYIFHDTIGFIHLVTAAIALIAGTYVLISRKGTTIHKRIGYIYFISMLIMLITSFMIYRLFGGFGIFHIAAIVSFVTILGGLIPVFFKKSKSWVLHHFSWTYWSIIGLYAAFASEILTRIPESPFFGMLGFATITIFAVGSFYFKKKQKIWKKQFYSNC